ncbi:PREDICTED: LOC18791226 isoform X1 [Prunus dulcis]|uniref:PREDICTED: LOC18791226 isoform X1 n=1 Tax=Prunus dulcis TaxID=3755 RepID=A0A5E4G5A2_PRUDU|nr:PREDICTED: LOC18791226 isoform X1 [Prunus dulcis]
MATKPFTGSSRKLSETQTELLRKETETVPPQKETESELQQNRTSEAENSGQNYNIHENNIETEDGKEIGIFDFNNEYYEDGAVDRHPGRKVQNNTDYNFKGKKIRSKKGQSVGIGKFGNKYYNSRKEEARSSSEEEGTSKKPCMKNTFYKGKVGIMNPKVMLVLIKTIEDQPVHTHQ